MIQQYAEMIVAFIKANEAWAAPIAFLLAFGESLAFVSLLLPSTVILLAIGGLIGSSGIKLWPVIVAAGVGGSLGYAISYWIGLYFKDRIQDMWPFKSHPDMIPTGRQFFERFGLISVFLGHFFGPVRAVIPVVAGMFKMPQIPFQIANISSAFLWAPGVIAPGYIIAAYKDPIFAFMRDNELLVAAAMFLIAFGQGLPNLVLFGPLLILFVAIGALHLFAGGHVTPILVASILGCFAGDLVSYTLGRKSMVLRDPDGARDYHVKDHKQTLAKLTHLWSLDWYPELVRSTRAFVKKSGLMTVITSKVMGARRALVPLVAGALGAPLGEFIVVSAIGSVMWAVLFLSVRPLLSLFGV